MKNSFYITLTKVAELINLYRIIPRFILLFYCFILVKVLNWAFNIDKLTMEQAGVVGAIVGVFSVIISVYVGNSKNKGG